MSSEVLRFLLGRTSIAAIAPVRVSSFLSTKYLKPWLNVKFAPPLTPAKLVESVSP